MTTFDPNATLRDGNGNEIRYILDPLDEQYIVEPISGSCPPSMLPTEEFHLRKLIAEVKLVREKQFELGVWTRLFNREKVRAYKANAENKERELHKLIHSSDIYMSSFKRILSVAHNPIAKKVLAEFLRIDSIRSL